MIIQLKADLFSEAVKGRFKKKIVPFLLGKKRPFHWFLKGPHEYCAYIVCVCVISSHFLLCEVMLHIFI